jgi:hypothetical protein
VRLKKQKVRVAAPRELLYDVVAAAGKKVGDTGRENWWSLRRGGADA